MGKVQVVCPDHIVIRCKDPIVSAQWYSNNLNLESMRVEEFKAGKVPFPSCRVSPTFIIDFFQRKNDEKSDAPVRNVDHFCLNVEADDINAVKQHLEELGVQAEEQFDGFVVKRFGAQGTAMSIYLKDPDGNIVELRTYAGQGLLQNPGVPAVPAAEAGLSRSAAES